MNKPVAGPSPELLALAALMEAVAEGRKWQETREVNAVDGRWRVDYGAILSGGFHEAAIGHFMVSDDGTVRQYVGV